MVLQRMLDYGFSGYQVPEIPRSCRSSRGRGPIGKKSEGNQKHSFQILASVDGKLSEKSDNSLHTGASCGKNLHDTCDGIILRKKVDEGQFLKDELLQHGSSLEKTFACNPGFQDHLQERSLHGSFCDQDNKRAFYDTSFVPNVPETKVEGEPTEFRNRSVKDETITVTCSSEDLMKLEGKPPQLVGPGHNVQPLFSMDCKNHSPFAQHTASVQAAILDDDENSPGPPPGTGSKRIKKISETSHWRAAPDLKEGNYSSTDGKVKEACYDERAHYSQEKTQKIYPFKKRKFFNQDFYTSNKGSNRDGAFNSSDKRINGKHCTAAIGASSSMTGQQVNPNSEECNVKLSIKSFKVPELFIDIPTNATVGSLKRTVMDAVTSILGEGVHVGILVQGKKVRDDNKTLVQTGISQDDKRNNLGFILEPKHSQTATSPCTKNKSLISRIRSQGLTRHSLSLTLQQGTSNVSLPLPSKNSGGSVEIDPNATPNLTDSSSNNANHESKALVAVPRISMEALAVVPYHRKTGHHEYVQRRIRRPFSVSEVEALVRAVEKLGTGRWRDVKFHAFDSAKHRTYVDLKDKWKTLVHTARISPQQRRGEPVPQELLDRVLAAQAYWSHRQAKVIV